MNINDYIALDKNGTLQIKDKRKFMIDWTGIYPGKYDTGVYMIGDFYIGKGDLRNRIYTHFRNSIQGIHYNTDLQNRITNHLFRGNRIPVRILSDKNSCYEERKWINEFKPVFNLCNKA